MSVTEHDDLLAHWMKELKEGSVSYRGLSLTDKDCDELLLLLERIRCGDVSIRGLRCTLVQGHKGPHTAVTRWNDE